MLVNSFGSDRFFVICAGLMKTGTVSLTTALETLLNCKCYCLQTALDNPSHVEFWTKASEEMPSSKEWQTFFEDYYAAVNFPANAFYKELMKAFPNAKVILPVRDSESWYRSVSKTNVLQLSSMNSFLNVINPFSLNERKFERMAHRTLERIFGIDISIASKAEMITMFERHIDEVRRSIPEERLLIYNVRQGWKPLCRFFDVPEPKHLFPHLNSSFEVLKKRRHRDASRFMTFLISASIVVCLSSLLYQNCTFFSLI